MIALEKLYPESHTLELLRERREYDAITTATAISDTAVATKREKPKGDMQIPAPPGETNTEGMM
uniref:CUE domain-containing protein n=1 Tax=Heterorhabditis bacteriophora TaxID=37862 RepID=A0A1I7X135_HETBA